MSQSLAGLPVPPRQTWTAVGLAVTERAPFTLSAKFDEASTALGKSAYLTVTAVRAPGFTEEIALTMTGLPPNVTPAPTENPGQHE